MLTELKEWIGAIESYGGERRRSQKGENFGRC